MPGALRFRAPVAQAAPLPDLWPGDERPLVQLRSARSRRARAFRRLYRAALDALAELPVRVLVTTGRAAAPGALGPLPPSVRAVRWLPQADVVAHADAIACHGGSGTVQAALAGGVPLAVLPLFADQPHNARRVAAIGAGVARGVRARSRPRGRGPARRPGLPRGGMRGRGRRRAHARARGRRPGARGADPAGPRWRSLHRGAAKSLDLRPLPATASSRVR